jgi:hypothetical protein
MNFELLPILTDYEIKKKGGWNKKKIFSSETTEPISTKLCWNDPLGRRWRTQFWKGTTKGSYQQSLVEIGAVVSEGKIFLISSPLLIRKKGGWN